ncbi:hypothetical protein D3C73_1671140 [compost metagenome]
MAGRKKQIDGRLSIEALWAAPEEDREHLRSLRGVEAGPIGTQHPPLVRTHRDDLRA